MSTNNPRKVASSFLPHVKQNGGKDTAVYYSNVEASFESNADPVSTDDAPGVIGDETRSTTDQITSSAQNFDL